MRKYKIETIFIFLTLIYFPLFIYFHYLNIQGGDLWLTADWLINFKYGYIRRGLIGEILRIFLDLNYLNLEILTFLLSLIYLFIIYFIYKIFKNNLQNSISYFLLYSPLFLLFPLLDFRSSFRKEILGFLVLTYVVSLINKKITTYNQLIIIALYTISIFSSEVNFLFLPFIYFIINNHFKFKKTLKNLLIFTSCLYLIFFFITLSSYDSKISLICSELTFSGFNENICDGSLSFMERDIKETLRYSIDEINLNKILSYSLSFLLGLIPFMFDKKWIHTNAKLMSLIFFYFITFFLISIDWGRWISIYFFGFSLIYFIDKDKTLTRFNFSKFIFILIYSLTWNVHHYSDTLNLLFVNLLENNILHYIKQLKIFIFF